MNATGGGGYGEGIALMLPTDANADAKCFLLFTFK